MDFLETDTKYLSLASLILLILFHTNRNLCFVDDERIVGFDSSNSAIDVADDDSPSVDMDATTRVTLHHLQVTNMLTAIEEDLGFWVKLRSTAWFTRFLLHEYDDHRWVQMFRMSKRYVISLSQLLSSALFKKDTKYRATIPVTVRVACALFKLSHGVNLLICSELFTIGRSTVSIILREVVHAINVCLRNEISWPSAEGVVDTAIGFQTLCGLPSVLGAIDATHFEIGKPHVGATNYFYFKSGGFTINYQAMVDSSKRFLDLYVGMPLSTNDARVLRRSTLFQCGQTNMLWENNPTFLGFSPYIIGDFGYPLLPWLLVPHRRSSGLPLTDAFFNRKLSRGQAVVENAFALLIQTFRELHQKSDLHVTFFLDVVTCCCILHNVLLKDSHEAVERLMSILCEEGVSHRIGRPNLEGNDLEDAVPEFDADLEDDGEVGDPLNGDADVAEDINNQEEGHSKRRDIGMFLALQHIVSF